MSLTVLSINLSGKTKWKVRVAPPYNTANDKIYITGSFNNWNPADEEYLLKHKKDEFFEVAIPKKFTEFEYKYTRGSWDTVEYNQDGSMVANRVFSPKKDHQDDIKNWYASRQSHHKAANVEILYEDFEMPQLKTKRRIWLYLPLDYYVHRHRYPVIYLQDGQNLFDSKYAAYGEWGIDHRLNELEKQVGKGVIVVGIDNAQSKRIDEYAPNHKKGFGGGHADQYTDFIINTLKPHIDKRFRTLADRQHTALGGSSMGGLFSLYAGIKHQEVFGKLLIFSPSLWFYPNIYEFVRLQPKTFLTKIFLLAGDQESEYMVRNMEYLLKNLKIAGFGKDELKMLIREGASHTESFWGEEFVGAYRYLFEV